jgi:hypothetical protein
MKNEKLEQLLNKVVEYNQPETEKSKGCNFKGFLYKTYRGYYIKVIEHITGTDIAVGDKIYLKEGEEQYVIHAEKPKLMRVDKNSWHYSVTKFVLGEKAPTPQTMQNGCPYFWLMIFSLLTCTFVAIWKGLKAIFMLLPKGFMFLLEKSVDNWMATMDEVAAYDIYNSRWYGQDKDSIKMPVTAKVFFESSDESFFDYFLKKKYGEGNYKYDEKSSEIQAKWAAWRKEVKEAREKREAIERERNAEIYRKEMEHAAKRAEAKAKWDERMKPFNDGMRKLLTSIENAFTFKGDTKNIIRRTKQVVGALITIVLLVGTFFFVQLAAYGLMFLVDLCIKGWMLFVALAALAAVVGIIYVVGVFIGGWLQGLVNEYKKGKKIWYVEPFIYLVWLPVKYVGLAIAYTFLYIIWKPIEYVIYKFLIMFVIVKTSKLIWKGLCAFGRGLANGTGVFGEYVNADYTGLCPGIEWTGFDEEDEK